MSADLVGQGLGVSVSKYADVIKLFTKRLASASFSIKSNNFSAATRRDLSHGTPRNP